MFKTNASPRGASGWTIERTDSRAIVLNPSTNKPSLFCSQKAASVEAHRLTTLSKMFNSVGRFKAVPLARISQT